MYEQEHDGFLLGIVNDGNGGSGTSACEKQEGLPTVCYEKRWKRRVRGNGGQVSDERVFRSSIGKRSVCKRIEWECMVGDEKEAQKHRIDNIWRLIVMERKLIRMWRAPLLGLSRLNVSFIILELPRVGES